MTESEEDDYFDNQMEAFDEILYDVIDEAMNPSIDDSIITRDFFANSARKLRMLYHQAKERSCPRCQLSLFQSVTR